MEVTHWEQGGPDFQSSGAKLSKNQVSDGNEGIQGRSTKVLLIKKFDKEINSIEAIKSLIVIMNERDRCSELRELEMKAHL